MIEYLKDHFITIDWLKKNVEKIHYFGLGFIQAKISNFERIHFYTNALTQTVEPEEIHNHRYDFVSRIYKGEFVQQIYDVNKSVNGQYLLTQESCDENNKLDFPKEPVDIKQLYEKTYYEDESYFMNHNTFHTVSAKENTITLLTRTDYKKEYADIVYHNSKTLTCPFSVKVSEDDLYNLIETILKP